jgi:hypothetical protein
MMAYFSDKDVISPKVSCPISPIAKLTRQLKTDVASGFEGLMKPHQPTNVGDWS